MYQGKLCNNCVYACGINVIFASYLLFRSNPLFGNDPSLRLRFCCFFRGIADLFAAYVFSGNQTGIALRNAVRPSRATHGCFRVRNRATYFHLCMIWQWLFLFFHTPAEVYLPDLRVRQGECVTVRRILRFRIRLFRRAIVSRKSLRQ